MLAGFRYMDRSHQERVITALFYRARSREGDGGWVVKSLRVGRTKTTSGGFAGVAEDRPSLSRPTRGRARASARHGGARDAVARAWRPVTVARL